MSAGVFLDELLVNLKRPGIELLSLVTGRPPMAKVGEHLVPISTESLETTEIFQLLADMGIAWASVGPNPSVSSVDIPGFGVLAVVAARRGEVVQAKFALNVPASSAPPAPGPTPALPKIDAKVPESVGSTSASASAPESSAPTASSVPEANLASGPTASTAPAPASEAASETAPSSVTPTSLPTSSSEPPAPGTPASGSGSADPWSLISPPDPAATTRPPVASPAAAPTKPPAPPAPAVPVEPMEFELETSLPPPPPAPPLPKPLLPEALSFTDLAPTPRRAQKPLTLPPALRSILESARGEAASDVHVIAGRPTLVRRAGELVPRGEQIDGAEVERMVLPIVPELLVSRLRAEGSCDFALHSDQVGRFRVNVSRQRTGYKACFRVIGAEVPTLASLGLPESIAAATHHHQGLILVTGPSGHGKTSTLTALVDHINRETNHHVITVEDPIEYVHARKKALISQREVGTHTKSFQSALKGSLREDPDVIVVGELRDTETVRMALSASETGHLLIATMNTPSAAKTIDRLIDLFPTGEQGQVRMSLSVGLRMIVSQRLLPDASGKGVVAAAELLPGSISLGNLIREEKTYQIPSLQQRGKSMGVVRFDDSLAELVKAGRTKLETALGYAEAPDELAALAKSAGPAGGNGHGQGHPHARRS